MDHRSERERERGRERESQKETTWYVTTHPKFDNSEKAYISIFDEDNSSEEKCTFSTFSIIKESQTEITKSSDDIRFIPDESRLKTEHISWYLYLPYFLNAQLKIDFQTLFVTDPVTPELFWGTLRVQFIIFLEGLGAALCNAT